MSHALQRYLNHHLAGSETALAALDGLASAAEGAEDKRYFLELRERIEKDQKLLRQLISSAGLKAGALTQATSELLAQVSKLKLRMEGMEEAELGRFEALELLTLGVEGKRLLWNLLGELAEQVEAWSDVDFAALEREAREQREELEKRRRATGLAALGWAVAAGVS